MQEIYKAVPALIVVPKSNISEYSGYKHDNGINVHRYNVSLKMMIDPYSLTGSSSRPIHVYTEIETCSGV